MQFTLFPHEEGYAVIRLIRYYRVQSENQL